MREREKGKVSKVAERTVFFFKHTSEKAALKKKRNKLRTALSQIKPPKGQQKDSRAREKEGW